ncbi:MAG: hypothetical protein ABS95_00720 [Verrucomicrobia bacterium SCN 57-15]|nr:MAG: hypothetical protein ABS95_00720 [Verrucomicrobia bacterium SCN 57-15]
MLCNRRPDVGGTALRTYNGMMKVIGLWVILAAVPLGANASIRVDNQTYDTVYLSRIGDPNTSVLIPKRMIGQFDVPLVRQGSPALETLLVTFPGNISVPETEFHGFNGRYAQTASIVIASPQNISISYEQDNNSSVANQTGRTNARQSGYYGLTSPTRYEVGRATQGNSNRPADSSLAALPTTIEPPRKQIVLPDKSGAKVRITSADSRYKLIEAPVPIRSQAKEVAKAAPPASVISPPSREKQSGRNALLTWIIVCIALVGFIAWKRLSSR